MIQDGALTPLCPVKPHCLNPVSLGRTAGVACGSVPKLSFHALCLRMLGLVTPLYASHVKLRLS